MKNWAVIIGLLMWAGSCLAWGGSVSLNPAEVVSLRLLLATNAEAANQFARLQRVADGALVESPRPVERIFSEGMLDTDPRKIHTEAALPDLGKIEALAWAWAVTGEEAYAAQARTFILAWARVNHSDGDAINETRFEPLIVGYDLLRGTCAEADRRLVDAWLEEKAGRLWKSPRGLTENWYSHRLKIVGLIGWTLGDQTLIDEAVGGFHRQINRNFKPDGASTDFYKRDALHYHIYDVEPLLVLARTGEREGYSFFNYTATNGATLRGGVDFVVPFAEGAKAHVEFVKSTVSFDRKRAENGQGEYAPHSWKPRAAVGMLAEAAWFRPQYGALAARLAGHPGDRFLNWPMVVNAVSQHSPLAK